MPTFLDFRVGNKVTNYIPSLYALDPLMRPPADVNKFLCLNEKLKFSFSDIFQLNLFSIILDIKKP